MAGEFDGLVIPLINLLRYLRNDWSGPKGAKMESEEAFALHQTKAPQTVSGNFTIVNQLPDMFPFGSQGNPDFPSNFPPGLNRSGPRVTAINDNFPPGVVPSSSETPFNGQTSALRIRSRPRRPTDPQDPLITVDRADGTNTQYAMTPTGINPVNPRTGKATASTTAAGGGGVPAKVTGGSGTSPTIDLYEAGTGSGTTQSVTAVVMQLASGESIPTGTWGFASQVSGTWYFSAQGGIWL